MSLAAGIAVCVFFHAMDNMQAPLMRHLQYRFYDATMQWLAQPARSPAVLMLDIDEKSLEEQGAWPWPRYRLARILRLCADAGAAAVGFDIFLSEADPLSFSSYERRMERDFGRRAEASVPEDLRDNDRILAAQLREHPAVLAGFFGGSGQDLPPLATDRRSLAPVTLAPPGAPDPLAMLPEAASGLLPLPELLDAGGRVGFINVLQARDGVVRRVPLLFRQGRRVYPSFALRMLMLGTGNEGFVLMGGASGLQAVGVGTHRIPVNPQGVFTPWFSPPGGEKTLSAADLLRGGVDPEELRGKYIIIGSSAAGIKDIRSTPMQHQAAGMSIHATVLQNFLEGKYLRIPAWHETARAGALAVCALLAAMAVQYLPASAALFAALLQGVLLWSASVAAMRFGGVYLSPVTPILATFFCFFSMAALKLGQESRQKRLLRSTFSRYIAPDMVTRILENPDAVALTGEERLLTIFFVDIRDFTRISESLPPEALVRLLNRYFSPVTRIIRAHSGTVDKFLGDACMAFWNAPLDVPEHSRKAAAASLEILEAIRKLNEDAAEGETIQAGIGLHRGTARVGNMGTEDLVNYTCIGDSVNVASRLEGLCKRYGAPFVTSRAVVEACASRVEGPVVFTESDTFIWMDRVMLKGHHEAMDIYTCIRDSFDEGEEGGYALAAEAYLAGNFAEAARRYEALAARNAGLPFLAVMASRCARLWREPTPPADWRGVWRHTEK